MECEKVESGGDKERSEGVVVRVGGIKRGEQRREKERTGECTPSQHLALNSCNADCKEQG